MKKELYNFKNKYWVWLLSAMMLSVMGLQSCREPIDISPVFITVPDGLEVTLEETSGTFRWNMPADERVVGFEVQLARDAAFQQILVSEELGADVLEYTFEDLASEEVYYARVRALSTDPLASSLYGSISFISNEIENIFRILIDENVGFEWVRIRWNEPEEGTVTHLVFTPHEMGEPFQVDLSAGQVSNREVLVEDLITAETYTVEIFDGEVSRGVMEFTTDDLYASITINGGDTNYPNLQAAINAASSGDEIQIGATIYDFSDMESINVNNKSLTIVGMDREPGSEARVEIPEIHIGNFNLQGDLGLFKVTNLKIVGNLTHIINTSEVTGNAEIEVTDCDISGARAGIVYASSSAGGIRSFHMDNCIVHDFAESDQGGDFIDFRSGEISSFLISNTTFYNVARDFLRVDGGAEYTGSERPTFINCTFDDLPARRFIYVRSGSFQATYVNSLLTNRKSDSMNGVLAEIYVDNCNHFGTDSDRYLQFAYVVEDLTEIDPEYANAAEGDFTLGSQALVDAQIGDPRWWP